MQYWWRRSLAPLLAVPLGEVTAGRLLPVSENGSYRGALLAITFVGFLAHVYVVASQSFPGSALWSNLLQLMLGATAVLALVEARKRSGWFARRIWSLAALAVGAYTAGQAIFTYCDAFLAFGAAAAWMNEVFFFWMVPLLAAVATSPADTKRSFDWTLILDFSLLVLLGVALHISVFGDSYQWQRQAQQVAFLRWRVHLIRDLVVLSCLLGRVLISHSRQSRALFLRLGIFFLAYTLADNIYLYIEANHHIVSGTWLDLLWSIPRVLAVLLALTWNWPLEIEPRRPATAWRHRYLLHYWAPILFPLAILALSSRMFSMAPFLWASLITATLGVVSVRLLVTQFRQEHALAGLQNSSTLLHSIIEGASEAVYLKDAQGRHLLMNSAGARRVQRTPAEVVGKTDRELFSPHEAEAILNDDREVMNSGCTVTSEETITVDGSPRTFLTTKNPYRDPQGRVIGVLGISVDITERRHMAEHMQRVQRMESLGTFSGGIAHDFNNLLTVIKGYSHLALNDPEAQPELRESVDQINKAAARASALVQQLLAFSRRQIRQPRVVCLNETVSSLQKMLGRLIGEDVEIQLRLCPDLGPVKADRGQIEQVVMNLAANARDAMPSGGTLMVETYNVNISRSSVGPDLNVPPGAYTLLAVSDTGHGMDAQTRARIFEPFFTTKPPGKGTGLGLATVYGIVEQNGGHVCVQSEPGAGTTFRIYFPRVNEPVENLTQSAARVAPQQGHQTILLVDDDLQLRELTQIILAGSGYTVLAAESGEEAQQIAKLHQGSIHLLLTDVVMPRTSGCEVARQIWRERPETRVLYTSGHPGDAIAQHCLLDPGIPFLPKPFTPDRLVEKVREILHAPLDAREGSFSKPS